MIVITRETFMLLRVHSLVLLRFPYNSLEKYITASVIEISCVEQFHLEQSCGLKAILGV